jgi:hypothetical protein
MSNRFLALAAIASGLVVAASIPGCVVRPPPLEAGQRYVVCGGATTHVHATDTYADPHLQRGDVIAILSLNPGKVTLAQHGNLDMQVNAAATSAVGSFDALHKALSGGTQDMHLAHRVYVVSQPTRPAGCVKGTKFIRVAFCPQTNPGAQPPSWRCAVTDPATTAHLGDVHAEN